MKKLTALILTLSMLLGMFAIPMGASATEVDEREAILNAKTYDYVDFTKNRDYFALYQEAADYGRFNQSADESTATSATSDKIDYTYTDPTTGETVTKNIYNWYPDTTYGGEPITLNEPMYSKGFGTYMKTDLKNAPYVFLMDDIINTNGSSYSAWYWPAASNTNKHHNGATYNGTLKRKEVSFKVGNSHKLAGPDENGNYIFGYGDAQFKVGPIIPDRQLHYNGRILTTSAYEVKNLDIKAESLDLLILNSHINTNMTGSKFAVGRGPSAGLQKVQIKYEGETDYVTKWVVVTDNAVLTYGAAYSTNPVEKMIVFAPKYETNEAGEKVEIDYANNGSWMYNNGENGFKWLKGNSAGVVDSMPTVKDVKFVNDDIIVGKAGRVAQKVGTRQDTVSQSAGADADIISIPLEDKKVASVKFTANSYVETLDTSIYIPASSTSTTYKAALVPVTIENVNASDEYVYFAFVGPTGSGTSLLGMTFTGESLKDKIDALNNVLAGLDSASLKEEDVANYRAQIAELKAESEYILDSDFDTSKLEEAEERIVDEKAAAFINAPAKINFPISEATGANSKMFLPKGSLGDNVGDNYSDYLPLLDHNGTTTRYSAATATEAGYTSGLGYYPTGTKADTVTNYGAIFYTIDGTTDNTAGNETLNFTKKNGQVYWNINGVDYNVDPTNKIIKLISSVHTDLIEDEELAAKYKTLVNTTFDVVDGYYDSIGFLVGTNADTARTFKYKLVYEDGTTSTLTSPGILNPSKDSATYRVAQGYIYHRMFNPTSTSVNRNASRGYRYIPVELDTDATRKLKEIQIIANDSWSALYLASAWGNAEPIATKLAAIEAIEVVDEESYAAAKNAINVFDAYIALLGYTLDDLGSYKAPYTDLKAEIAEYELKLEEEAINSTDDRVWFDFDGNSKFFVKQESSTKYVIGETTYDATSFTNFRTNFKDYLPGVDFSGYVAAPTGDFEQDQPAVVNSGHGGSMFLYTVDKNTNATQYAMPDFKTGADGHLYWTINDVAYRVNPKKNVIKVIKNAIDTSAITDAEKKARYESVNAEAVIDVENGKYKNIGILAGLTAGSTRTATVTLVYSDKTEEKKVNITTTKTSAETNYLMGTLYLQNFTNTGTGGSNALGGHGFVPVTIATDPTKTLVEIRIKDATNTSSTNCIYVLSAWGVAVPEISNASYADGKVTIDYSAVATTKSKVLVVEYSQDEKEFKKLTVIPALFTKNNSKLEYYVKTGAGNKVKVFVWRDLIDFFPYK